MAGIGGVDYIDCYKLPNLKISLDNHTVEIPEIVVKTEQEAGGLYKCNVGLRTLMLYSFVRFNLVDFVMTTGIPIIPVFDKYAFFLLTHKVHNFTARISKLWT